MTGKPLVPLIEYEMADEAVRAVYDDIMATRQVDWVNNFWKVLAHDPAVLKRTWETIKEVMAPGALDPLVKEMIYIANQTNRLANALRPPIDVQFEPRG